ncbi:branched-chain amino acid transport system II carrier protein [Bacillus sp. JJ722]|uniref:branched-chain amino acid transport system II carrier protein n=1 Tax=Bacillus sp. JJ722 TaxID=3122973 RepID=UPI002FFEC85A
MKQNKNGLSSTIAIGFMLFALFFGAGNLIFPVLMGQMAGTNVWPATIGFIVTGVGLPLLGVLAIGFSGKGDLYSVASRVHPMFGLVFTTVLYLTIGPLFAIPRTGSVSYEVGIKPLLGDTTSSIPLVIFTIIFFAITCIFSLKPGKIVDIVGKILTPVLIIVIALLIGAAIFNPMGDFTTPNDKYTEFSFFKGFQEGYLTMDTLASLVFGIIVINAVKERGARTKSEILSSCFKSAMIAAGLLAVIYGGLAYLGASSVNEIGMLENGGSILAASSGHYFGSYGSLILGLIVIAACLTTSIGLVTACSAYFNKLLPSISYTTFAIILSMFSTVVANVGLENLIAFSVPVLVAIYPLAICLIALTFLHRFFQGRSSVYIVSLALAFLVSLFDGLNAAGIKVEAVNNILSTLPLYSVGLGWILPAILGAIVGYFMNFNSGKVVTE